MPSFSGRPVVRRRDLRQGRWPVDLPIPAIDQYGQVVDVLLSARRDLAAARRLFARALRVGTTPS